MLDDSSAIVQKVWNYAHVLKNAGFGYGDYVEQLRIPFHPITSSFQVTNDACNGHY